LALSRKTCRSCLA